MLQIVALAELLIAWLVWCFAFLKPRKQAAGRKEIARAPSSRWGIILQTIGFALVWIYVRPSGEFEKSWMSLVSSMVLAPLSVALAWMAARQLGKQWRFEAAISEGHELVRTGPYRWVRHPIYASMFGMLLATGFCWTWWPMFVAAVVVFVIGTEIRVRDEDRLLGEHFRAEFSAYRSNVRAYIPFVR